MLPKDEIIRICTTWVTDPDYFSSIDREAEGEKKTDYYNHLWDRLCFPGPQPSLTWANLVACRSRCKKVAIRRVTEYLETEIAIANVCGAAQ